MARRSYPKNTKLPSDNPPAPHPLRVHLTPGTHGRRERSASVASVASAATAATLESNQITNRLRLRRRLRQIKYVDGFCRMTTHSVLLLLLLSSFLFTLLLVVVFGNGRVCVCVAMLYRVVSFSFPSLPALAKRFMCAFCRFLFVAPPGGENAYLFLWYLRKRILSMFSLV